MGEREDLIAAVRDRVDRVAATRDGSAVLDQAALALSRRLADLCDAGSGADLAAEHALGRLHHYRAEYLDPERSGPDRRLAVRLLAWCFIREFDDVPQPLLVPIAEGVLPFAADTLNRARDTLDPPALALAESLHRRIAVILPEHHPDRAPCLSHLGIALMTRYGGTLRLADADEAVEVARAAVRAPSDDPRVRAAALNNLGLALRMRFEHTWAPADLDDAVDALRGAVRTVPEDAPARMNFLLQLARALEVRYESTEALTDLDEAVETSRTALRIASDEPPHLADHLAQLGGALMMRYERTGAVRDLEEAVERGRAALRALPDGWPHAAPHLSSLAAALRARFAHTEASADLDEAVELSRAAVRILPGHYPPGDHALYRFSLAGTLLTRAEHAPAQADLDEAVELLEAALDATSGDHLHRTVYLTHLGRALILRSEHSGTAEDRERALVVVRQVAEDATTPPRFRIATARTVAQMIAVSDPAQAAALLERAVQALPEVASRRLERGDQQHALAGLAAGLAADAAALALADTTHEAPDRAVRALRLAEAGRTVLLSQALDTRSDLTDLRDRHPDLAARFLELRASLDQDVATAPPAVGGTRGSGGQRERHRLAAEFAALLKRIRNCEGFAGFGLPPTLDELLAEAALGPVVTFNVSRYRGDALLLTPDGVTSCPLPRLTQDAVVHQAETFYQALEAATAPDRDRVAAQRTLRGVLEWLWDAAAQPALSALTDLGHAIPPAHDGEPLPRVWWSPGGLLGLLPLHAAGFHTDTGTSPRRRTVMDRVVSSYTPTVRMLRHARRPRPATRDDARSLIVAVPAAPGLDRLRYVPEEARRIRALLPQPLQLTAPEADADGAHHVPGDDIPTTATVLARLPECSIAHFACHGATDRTDPSRSRLFLHDNATSPPLTVSALARVDLERARLAYLSACSTADPGNAELLDEAIHLTSGFQVAGFRHVVGTLWPIDDRVAAEIAESFYRHLSTGTPGTPGACGASPVAPGSIDPDRAALALHHAVRAVRDRYPATPSLWAAHLHSGA
ncbi:CHAT domain-containing protein [Streptomyces sp. NPDC047886]|uniref:CHAT domain-containing protein n=1 Tax=Streptomyces sp. NPDC047886 TaxID=3365490 RepID=UPI00371C87E3